MPALHWKPVAQSVSRTQAGLAPQVPSAWQSPPLGQSASVRQPSRQPWGVQRWVLGQSVFCAQLPEVPDVLPLGFDEPEQAVRFPRPQSASSATAIHIHEGLCMRRSNAKRPHFSNAPADPACAGERRLATVAP